MSIPRTNLQRPLKDDLHIRAWKPCQVQFLTEAGRENRVQCCRSILDKYENPQRRKNLFFSNECAFYGDGKHINSIFWSKENSHFYEQVQQHSPSAMAWVAINTNHIIGPFFINSSVTANAYIKMLRTDFLPE